MVVRKGSQTGPRTKFAFRNIPLEDVVMEMASNDVNMEMNKDVQMN